MAPTPVTQVGLASQDQRTLHPSTLRKNLAVFPAWRSRQITRQLLFNIGTLRPVQAGTGIEDVSDLVHMDAEIERYPRPDTHLPLLNWDPSLANF